MFNKIKAKRVEFGYNQQDMAQKLKMTRASYVYKENGHIRWNYDDIIKILKIFNCKFEDIFLDRKEK